MRYISYCTHQLQPSLSAWKQNLPEKIIEKDLIEIFFLYLSGCRSMHGHLSNYFYVQVKIPVFNCHGVCDNDMLCNSLKYSDRPQYPGMIMKIAVMMPGT